MSENLVPELCRTKEQITDVANERGLYCLFPDNNELTLDIDKSFRRTYLDDNRVLQVLEHNNLEIQEPLLFTRSVSGNTHVWIRMGRPMDAASRIALQAALGSDPVREALCLLRHQCGSKAPIALFETEEGAKEVQKWRESFVTEDAFGELGWQT